MSHGPCPLDGLGIPKYFTYIAANHTCAPDPTFFGKDSAFRGHPVLSQGVGYAIVVGFGIAFGIITAVLVWLDQKYSNTVETSEWFNTAGRDVKTGLIAAVVVSQWTWAATILQSSNVAFEYGVSGPFWYASGATIQVLLFGILAIEIKRKAPTAHTVAEIVRARWGTNAHIVFLFFNFLTNIIVTAMLLLGGSSVVTALTGINVYAASFLIPIGIIIYTLAGGLKATFLAAYLHSVIIHVVLVIFIYLVYAGGKYLGSPSKVYDNLQKLAKKSKADCRYAKQNNQACGHVSGNHGGSYVTMLSTEGFVFGVINIIGNFGTVFVDNAYWMAAIAARPSSSHKGYLLGGMVWFCVPFSLGTSLGLAALALNLPITYDEAGRGLVPPASAVALMGTSGAGLILTMLFMAVTSAGSAELIAVSSLITYDIYRTYINPNATGKQMLTVSRIGVLFFGIFMGVLAVLLNLAGVSLGWMYLAMGVFIGSAVIPIALCILWKRANAIGAIAASIIGSFCAVITWLVWTQIQYGRVDLKSTGKNAPMLAGNLVAIILGGVIHLIFSLLRPENYDFESMRQIPLVEDYIVDLPASEYDPVTLNHSKWWIVKWGVGFTFLIILIWPAISLAAGVFSKWFFYIWVILSIIWGTVASIVIIFLPLWEAKAELWGITYATLSGKIFKSDPTDKTITTVAPAGAVDPAVTPVKV